MTTMTTSTAITLTAKWPSTCFECGDRIEPGEQISWDREAPRGQNTSHVRCPGYDDGENVPTAVPVTIVASKPARRPVGLQRRATSAAASTSNFPPTDEQLEAQRLFGDDADLAIEAGAGCLAADTIININRAGKGSQQTIKHVVCKSQGVDVFFERELCGKRITQKTKGWNLSISTGIARADGGVVRLGKLKSAWYSGIKETYTLTTETGRSVRATQTHPFLTADGVFARLLDLRIGDSVQVNTGRSTRGRGSKSRYRYADTRFHPHQTCRSSVRQRYGVPVHRLIIEAEINSLPFDEFIQILRMDNVRAGRLIYLDEGIHVHHKDENSLNNSRSNLEVMTAIQHHQHHSNEFGDHVLWQVGNEIVTSITPYGEEPTYDIEVENDPHNFLANGFVVHNTGKTATLILLANSTPRRGQYLAFNKAIVQEAAMKMPATVTCSTAHSLAYRSVGFKYAARLGSSRRMRSADIASHLKIAPLSFGEVTLSPSFLAGHVMNAVTYFCQSAAAVPNQFHVPHLPMPNPDEAAERHQLLAAHILPAMSAAWNDLMDVDGMLPFKHEHYLKAWQLSGPRINADYILFDEAQDANGVMLAIVDAQDHAQRVYVGDANQAIYGFTGAVNALERIRESGGQIATLTQSFRFGPAIADKANQILDLMPESTLRLTGTETIDSVVEPVRDPNVILCRTNAGAVATVMRFQKTGKRVALVGGGDAFVRFAKAAQTLMTGGRTEHPELACFSSWQSVRAYVDEDGQGSELRLLVKLIDDFGVDGIIAALSRLQDERTAEITVSTAHKSKGREWKAVQLASDFMPVPKMNIDELRLLYVAVTRAKLRLDDTQIDYVGEED